MEKIYLLQVQNGQDYEDFREWPWVFVPSEKEANELMRITNLEIELLFKAAQDHAYETDYIKPLFESAPGKRYVKYLKEKGIIDRKEQFFSYCPYTIHCYTVSKAAT